MQTHRLQTLPVFADHCSNAFNLEKYAARFRTPDRGPVFANHCFKQTAFHLAFTFVTKQKRLRRSFCIFSVLESPLGFMRQRAISHADFSRGKTLRTAAHIKSSQVWDYRLRLLKAKLLTR